VVEQILNYLDKFTPEILLIQVGFLLIVISVFTFFWIQNKRKFNHLKHQIPANVVKNYLDSIIQNSSSLKSSLFRGGGLDIDPNGIPSVFPVGSLDGKDQADVMGTNSEELRLKIAELAQLKAQLAEKNNMLRDFEGNVTNLRGETRNKQDRIEELEKLLAAARGGAPAPVQDNSALKNELAGVTKERDELRQKLQEYSVIEDDLADLKRLKQENEQLKRSLGQAPSAPKLAEESFQAPEVESAPVLEEAPLSAPVIEEEAPVIEEAVASAEPSPAEEVPAAPESKEKSPEDLLSEFEKMLG
jgi:hypothetical protein